MPGGESWNTWPEAQEIIQKYHYDKESIRNLAKAYHRDSKSIEELLDHAGVRRRRGDIKTTTYSNNGYTHADPFREFTDTTWILIALMLDEDKLSLTEIAEELRRSPAFLIQMVSSTRGQRSLHHIRERLIDWDGLYALKHRRRLL